MTRLISRVKWLTVGEIVLASVISGVVGHAINRPSATPPTVEARLHLAETNINGLLAIERGTFQHLERVARELDNRDTLPDPARLPLAHHAPSPEELAQIARDLDAGRSTRN